MMVLSADWSSLFTAISIVSAVAGAVVALAAGGVWRVLESRLVRRLLVGRAASSSRLEMRLAARRLDRDKALMDLERLKTLKSPEEASRKLDQFLAEVQSERQNDNEKSDA